MNNYWSELFVLNWVPRISELEDVRTYHPFLRLAIERSLLYMLHVKSKAFRSDVARGMVL